MISIFNKENYNCEYEIASFEQTKDLGHFYNLFLISKNIIACTTWNGK